MRDLIPERGDVSVAIPMTLDVRSKRDNLSLVKIVLGGLMIFAGFVLMIIGFIFFDDSVKPLVPLALGFGTFIGVRFIFLKEWFYKKKQKDLIENDYTYSSRAYWGIYSINEYYPFICKRIDNMLIIFVAFDKDVIIGRDNDADYDHYEAIANAYALMVSKGISCIHIDYADTVGKDDRMNTLFDNLADTENRDIRNETIRLYDYVQSYMYRSYADYDIYAFMYGGREEAFWDDLQPVLDAFGQANYVRNRILSREEIGDLCISLMNLNDFSTTKATERAFLSNVRASNTIKVIWTEKDGERTVVNRTRDEIAAERRVTAAENVVKENRRRKNKKKRGKKQDAINMDEALVFDDDIDDYGKSEEERSTDIGVATGDNVPVTDSIDFADSDNSDGDDSTAEHQSQDTKDLDQDIDIFIDD